MSQDPFRVQTQFSVFSSSDQKFVDHQRIGFSGYNATGEPTLGDDIPMVCSLAGQLTWYFLTLAGSHVWVFACRFLPHPF